MKIEIMHQKPERGLDFYASRLYIAKHSMLPVCVERYGWPEKSGEKPALIEEYRYTNIKTNVGLTDRDFDPANAEYKFSGGK